MESCIKRAFDSFIRHKRKWGFLSAIGRIWIRYAPPVPFYQAYIRSKLTASPRLQLGCGLSLCNDWTHQDKARLPGIHLVLDVRRLRKYIAPASLDAIFTSHMLEHLPRYEVLRLMDDFRDWLRPKGELWIAVPNVSTLIEVANDPLTTSDERDLALELIATPWPGHVSAWLEHDLRMVLDKAGFEKIETWASPPHELTNAEGCWNHCIAGRMISLNLRACKKAITP